MSNSVTNKHLKILQRRKKEQKRLDWKNNRKDCKQKEEVSIEYNDSFTYYLLHDEPLQSYEDGISFNCEFEHASETLASTFIGLDVDIHDYKNNNFGCDGYHATMCLDCYHKCLYKTNIITCLINKNKKEDISQEIPRPF
jgi:hypothetical protein